MLVGEGGESQLTRVVGTERAHVPASHIKLEGMSRPGHPADEPVRGEEVSFVIVGEIAERLEVHEFPRQVEFSG